MKKTIFAALGLTLFTLLTGCDNLKQNNNSTKAEVSFENMYNYSAISGINMLNNIQSTTSLKKKQLTDNEKQDIINNLKVVENMLDGNMIKSEEVVSDKEGYEKKYSITTTSLNNIQKEYTFYYNETLLANEDDDEDEVNIKLSGLVIMDEIEYTMIGSKEVEDDESEMKFKISLDEANYVVIEQELESNETEFSYSQYQNNKKVYETSIEFETDKDGKVEFEFEEKTQENKTKLKYEFIIKKDGSRYVIIKEKNKEVTKIKIEVAEDGSTNYIFE